MVVRAVDAALHLAPEAFDVLGVRVALGHLFFEQCANSSLLGIVYAIIWQSVGFQTVCQSIVTAAPLPGFDQLFVPCTPHPPPVRPVPFCTPC